MRNFSHSSRLEAPWLEACLNGYFTYTAMLLISKTPQYNTNPIYNDSEILDSEILS